MSKKSTGCVISGDIRYNTEIIIKYLSTKFDFVIVSTWSDEQLYEKFPCNVYFVINSKPRNAGFQNRNLQRYSTARGLDKARELAVNFVLKWRTDMLPTSIDVNKLIELATTDCAPGDCRIVTCAFRNLTAVPDWYSSMPDLFAFGCIEKISLLWGDEDFCYDQSMNPPKKMLEEIGYTWDSMCPEIWCAESELYSIFKDRLQRKYKTMNNHEAIVKKHFYLLSHLDLGIVWFDKIGKYRPVAQAYEHHWWTLKVWQGKLEVRYVAKGYKVNTVLQHISGKIGILRKRLEMVRQANMWKKFKCQNNISFHRTGGARLPRK